MNSLKIATVTVSIGFLLVIILSFITHETNLPLIGMVGTAWGVLITALANENKKPKGGPE